MRYYRVKEPNELKKLSEETLLKLLQDIENRKVTVTLDRAKSKEAIEDENGIYHFETSNKWKIGVSVDCGKFDYIQYVSHGGAKIDFDKICRYCPKADQYSEKFRDTDLAKKVWGIEAKIFADL